MARAWNLAMLVAAALLALSAGCAVAQPAPVAAAETSEEFAVLAGGPISPEQPDRLLVIFNAPAQAAAAQNAANYALNGKAAFASAQRHATAQNLVYLTLKPAEQMTPGISYFIKVSNVVDQQGRALAATGRNSNTFRFHTLQSASEYILRCQLPDGALAMAHDTDQWQAGQPLWIVPYFGQRTLMGLLDAEVMAHDARFLAATRKFLTWYAAQMRADGTVTDYTGNYPNYTSTGTYDSSDSYAALHLELAWAYYLVSADKAYLDTIRPSFAKAVAAIELTLQPDGLTWAKPDYLVKYSMDNFEVARGLDSGANLARLMGDAANETKWRAMSAKVLNAVNTQLYLGDAKGYYSVGKFANNTLADTWSVYYADGMAQCTAINMGLEPTSARAQLVWNTFKSKFIPNYLPNESLDFEFAWSAIRMGDAVLTDIGYVMMQHNALGYSTDAGLLLSFMRLARGSEQSACREWARYH